MGWKPILRLTEIPGGLYCSPAHFWVAREARMARVDLEKVTKIYPGNVRAVNAIDLLIKDQEFVVLVGPSGCGKSTTLRMVAGLEEITDGVIRIGDRVV